MISVSESNWALKNHLKTVFEIRILIMDTIEVHCLVGLSFVNMRIRNDQVLPA